LEIVGYLKAKYPYNIYFDMEIYYKLYKKEGEKYSLKRIGKIKEIIPQYFKYVKEYDILILINKGIDYLSFLIMEQRNMMICKECLLIP
jgi:hypothetical protein